MLFITSPHCLNRAPWKTPSVFRTRVAFSKSSKKSISTQQLGFKLKNYPLALTEILVHAMELFYGIVLKLYSSYSFDELQDLIITIAFFIRKLRDRKPTCTISLKFKCIDYSGLSKEICAERSKKPCLRAKQAGRGISIALPVRSFDRSHCPYLAEIRKGQSDRDS